MSSMERRSPRLGEPRGFLVRFVVGPKIGANGGALEVEEGGFVFLLFPLGAAAVFPEAMVAAAAGTQGRDCPLRMLLVELARALLARLLFFPGDMMTVEDEWHQRR